ncbi:peptidyl-prolyl cis-trans isomerase cpr6 [Pycnococcus provasolii]|uniref:peptidylprolyl isomerase n=1 Tax=Pycnococcus provasolii TaxID=41880 RepID=A0A830HHW0_9CHLO|nr:peptidyl-prolyl cis-trans isomerase cpr6 [Pycnococcus provasolii]
MVKLEEVEPDNGNGGNDGGNGVGQSATGVFTPMGTTAAQALPTLAIEPRGKLGLPTPPTTNAPMQDKYEYIDAIKAVGNQYFKAGDFDAAGPTYTDAVRAALAFYPDEQGGKNAMLADEKIAPIIAKCYSNSAMAALKVKQPTLARDMCNSGLECRPTGDDKVKLLTRKADAHLALDDADDAVECLQAALAVDPNNVTCKRKLYDAKQALKASRKAEAERSKQLFGGAATTSTPAQGAAAASGGDDDGWWYKSKIEAARKILFDDREERKAFHAFVDVLTEAIKKGWDVHARAACAGAVVAAAQVELKRPKTEDGGGGDDEASENEPVGDHTKVIFYGNLYAKLSHVLERRSVALASGTAIDKDVPSYEVHRLMGRSYFARGELEECSLHYGEFLAQAPRVPTRDEAAAGAGASSSSPAAHAARRSGAQAREQIADVHMQLAFCSDKLRAPTAQAIDHVKAALSYTSVPGHQRTCHENLGRLLRIVGATEEAEEHEAEAASIKVTS